MQKRNLYWKKMAAASMAAMLLVPAGFGGTVFAQEDAEVQEFLELTAQDIQVEESDAVYAHLKIGDWLDYGDYSIERSDIPGTDYFFYITTKDKNGTVINDKKLGYCMQSYFLTPLPGEHSDEMTDNISAFGGKNNLHKVFYYGFGGAGYDAAEFESFLEQSFTEYYETVYAELSDNEKEELSYVLTHGAASYVYFTDGTPLEEYLKLQFEMKYGENWEKELGYFTKQELKMAGIEDGDLNLLGATYGMTPEGIAMAEAWHDVLLSKKDPVLDVTCENGVYTFNGNERNEELTLDFMVPEGFVCTQICTDGTEKEVAEGKKVTVHPSEQFSFVYVDEKVALEAGGISQLEVAVDGSLTGAEEEVWNLVLIQTNKGNSKTIDKRQQDIAAVSLTNAGLTELDFDIELQKASVSVALTNDAGQPIQGAVLELYYDQECTIPVCQDGEAVQLTTDAKGEAYLEFVLNQKIQENGGKLYVKEAFAPVGNELDEAVYSVDVNGTVGLINTRETTAVNGAVELNLPENVKLPAEMTVELLQDGEVIDSCIITQENGWSYEWDELLKYDTDANGTVVEHQYAVNVTIPDGYVMETDNGQIKVKAAEPAEAVIEASVNLNGRDLKEGEFSFELRQVTDASGETVLADGITGTAVNDAEGNVVFNDITLTEPGTYYFEITAVSEEEPVSFIAEVKVSVDAENKGQLVAEVTYPNGQPEFEQVYEASGEVMLEGIQVTLENDELEAGEFTFELKDEAGNVLQTAVNDAEGNVIFEALEYSEEDIGKEYVYTITQVTDASENVVGDEQSCTITVKVEDSENSDGTLSITQVIEEAVFENVYVEPETETETEVATEAETETEIVTEAETETEVVTEVETETEIVTEAETETEVVTEVETETEVVTEAETETEAVTESETEAASEEGGNGFVLPISIGFIILLLILLFERAKKRADK